ncbi:hypothetical protein LCGC14_1232080 [marine sediment metagenome]|uniref:Uncharacterized protein n=1 Tax=marine sediment metagenome TaxID=412755 RepID=A0A0F9NQG5_9ZZZZ
MAKKKEAICVPQIEIAQMRVPITGRSPLICDRMKEAAREVLEGKARGKACSKKEPLDVKKFWKESLYPIPGKKNKYGFPAAAFKSAIVSACRYVKGIPMTLARGAIYVTGDFVEIKGTPVMKEDIARNNNMPGGGAAVYVVRGCFPNWSAVLFIEYRSDVLTGEMVVNLISQAGFSVGVGCMRPEKGNGGNQNGRWRL